MISSILKEIQLSIFILITYFRQEIRKKNDDEVCQEDKNSYISTQNENPSNNILEQPCEIKSQ